MAPIISELDAALAELETAGTVGQDCIAAKTILGTLPREGCTGHCSHPLGTHLAATLAE